jgi:hypothetical protein
MNDESSFYDFNEVEYRCIFIYFDVNKNTFFFDHMTDNKVFDELVKIDINSPSYKTDVFLYNSLLDSILYLYKNNLIKLPIEYIDSLNKISLFKN